MWDGRSLPWGVGPAGRWVRVLGRYLDPAGDRDLYGLQNPIYGGTKKFLGPSSWLGGARGHE